MPRHNEAFYKALTPPGFGGPGSGTRRYRPGTFAAQLVTSRSAGELAEKETALAAEGWKPYGRTQRISGSLRGRYWTRHYRVK